MLSGPYDASGHRGMRHSRMDAERPAARTCPACGSPDYAFRSRKKIPADPQKGQPEVTETKYRCKGCAHEWKVRTPAA